MPQRVKLYCHSRQNRFEKQMQIKPYDNSTTSILLRKKKKGGLEGTKYGPGGGGWENIACRMGTCGHFKLGKKTHLAIKQSFS